MRDVAISAAVFVGALIAVPVGAAVTATSFFEKKDAQNTHTIINKPNVLTDARPNTATASSKKSEATANLAAATTQTPVPTAPPKADTVQPGDTLTSIATEHGTTFNRVYDANPAVTSPDMIMPGQELRIPAADEQLAPRPLPENAPAEAKAEAVTTAPEEAYAPVPASQPVSTAPAVADGSVWDRLAQCEATGNWAINTGNGFYGGLQFTLSSWAAVGGTGMPHQASREEQILRGEKLLAMQGWGAWPACTAKLGLR